jgi:hypothetical protein
VKRAQFVLSRVFLIFVGLLLAFVALEILLRVLQVPSRQSLVELLEEQWESDGEFLLHLKPNLDMQIRGHPEFSYTVQTNSDGLRDEPFIGSFDIATIGDSFTFGFGVEEFESWSSRLESMSGKRVANLGWAGWSSYIYPTTIRRHAIPLDAHIWLWAFFYNDLPESAGAEEFLISGETDFKSWVNDRQQMNPFLGLRSIEFLMAIMDPELFLLPNSGDLVYKDQELQMRVSRYAWEVTDPSRPEVQRGWELTEESLLEAKELADQHHAELVLLFIPSREHVYWSRIEGIMEGLDVKQLDDVEARLQAFAEANDIEYLNLLSGFRREALHNEILYFPSDGHWNARGHALAARLIQEFLADHDFLDT